MRNLTLSFKTNESPAVLSFYLNQAADKYGIGFSVRAGFFKHSVVLTASEGSKGQLYIEELSKRIAL